MVRRNITGPREHALRAYRLGYAAAQLDPRPRCPYDPFGSPRDRLAVRLYARGLVNAQLAAGVRPPPEADERPSAYH